MIWRRGSHDEHEQYIDVPNKKPWMRRWFARAVRFSILVGAVVGAWSAWSDLKAHNDDVLSWAQSEVAYECAARLDSDTLSRHTNEFGNIDVSPLGCSSRPFYVSPEELRDVREGKMKFQTNLRPFYPDKTAINATASAIGTLLLTTVAILFIRAIQWAWG